MPSRLKGVNVTLALIVKSLYLLMCIHGPVLFIAYLFCVCCLFVMCLCEYLGPIGDYCHRTMVKSILFHAIDFPIELFDSVSINTTRLFTEGSVIPPEHRLMLVNFHRECIGDAKKSPVGPRHELFVFSIELCKSSFSPKLDWVVCFVAYIIGLWWVCCFPLVCLSWVFVSVTSMYELGILWGVFCHRTVVGFVLCHRSVWVCSALW